MNSSLNQSQGYIFHSAWRPWALFFLKKKNISSATTAQTNRQIQHSSPTPPHCFIKAVHVSNDNITFFCHRHGNARLKWTERRPWPRLNPGNTAAGITGAPWPRAFESLASRDKAVGRFTCRSADGEINREETSGWTECDTHHRRRFISLSESRRWLSAVF